MKKTIVLSVRGVPVPLRSRLKSEAAMRETTMEKLVVDLLQESIDALDAKLATDAIASHRAK